MTYQFIKKEEVEKWVQLLPYELDVVNPLIFGVDEDGTPLGVCVLDRREEGQMSLDWIYVIPERRKTGLAKGMLEEVVSMADQYDISLYAAYKKDPVINHLLLQFGFNLHSDILKEYTITRKEFQEAIEPILKKLPAKNLIKVKSLKEISEKLLNKLLEKFEDPTSKNYMQLTLEMLEDADPDISMAVIMDHEIKSIMLLKRESDTDCRINWVWDEQMKPFTLATLVREMLARVDENYLKLEKIHFDAVTDSVANFAKEYFANAKVNEIEMIQATY